MSDSNSAPVRYVGLDIHKAYLVAAAVNADQEAVYGPRRVPLTQLSDWIVSDLLCTDRVVLEMTTNTWAMCDALAGHVASVTVVHPPQVALIVRARVMTDRKAALILAQLHAAHLLPAVWIPPQPVRDLRTLIAQRQKMVRLTTTARNRLHAVLHRHHLLPPLGQGELFSPELRSWWQDLPLSEIEAIQVQCDLDTLAFARAQQERLQAALNRLAARDERVPLLVQLPGIGVTSAMTILAAAFSLRLLRLGDLALVAVSGVGLGFLFFFINQFTTAMGSAEVLPPVVAAWLPSFLTALSALTLLIYTEDG